MRHINFIKLSYYLAAVVVMITLLLGIAVVQKNMNAIIVEKKLTDTDPIENAPPVVAVFTIVLGSFRGLLADVLWLRTIALQDQGRYFEMVQLASWMTKLQPRFTGATAYLAWNMAYNISVTCADPFDRWRWVQKGIELIRDEALNYNPGDPTLYKELGWIYQHKIGNIMDDANKLYKAKLATELMKVFGAPEPDWQKLADAPKEPEEVEEYIGKDKTFWERMAKAEVVSLANLQDNLRAEGKSETEIKNALKPDFGSLSRLEKAFRSDGKMPEAAAKEMSKAEKEYLSDYFRAHWLRTVYKLYPEEIVKIDKKYGRLDWRLAESQAIYWATLGLKHARDHKDINCERMITQSIKDSFMRGRILMIDGKDFKDIMTLPNLNVVDAVRQTYLDAYEKNKDTRSFRSALENFMKDAIVTLFTYGRYSKAKEYFKILIKEYPERTNYRQMTLGEFVEKEWKEDVKDANMDQANMLVNGLLLQSYLFLAKGDYDAYAGYQRRARFIYDRYQKEQDVEPKKNGKETRNRTGLLLSFPELRSEVIKKCYEVMSDELGKNLKFALEQGNEEKKQKENNKRKIK